MAKSNNVLLVLTIMLLLVSLFGTFALLSNIVFEITPAEGPPATQKGEIKLEILPEPGSMSTTGQIGLEILSE